MTLTGAAAHGFYSRHGICTDRAFAVLTPTNAEEPFPLMVTFYPPYGCWMAEPYQEPESVSDAL